METTTLIPGPDEHTIAVLPPPPRRRRQNDNSHGSDHAIAGRMISSAAADSVYTLSL